MPPKTTKSQRIRAQIKHPVIDADGHLVEFLPPLEDYVRAIGGSSFSVRFFPAAVRYPAQSDSERRQTGTARPPWWVTVTSNTLDRATVALPKLLAERMEEFGLDYAVLFPTTIGFEVYRRNLPAQESRRDPEVQRVAVRALNAYRMDLCREHADRMTPVAGLRLGNPREAIEDLDHAVQELGYKAVSIRHVFRPLPGTQRPALDSYNAMFCLQGGWVDCLGLDSAHDYDPFWARCAELRVPVLCHGNSQGFTPRASPSNHVYNHIGNFAEAGEALCKAIFLGGVTRRFPTLRFGFLEGGVAWACRTYGDLVGHWEKRNRTAVRNMDPANLNRDLFLNLHKRYGGKWLKGRTEQVLAVGVGLQPEAVRDPSDLDDFFRCQIESVEDIRELFVPRFFFGCEADDPTNAMAFNAGAWPLGAKLNAIFSSDMGHWDVPEINHVVAEAYELVERNLITPDDFRAFTFTNAVELFVGANPNFFKGTAIEAEAANALKAAPARKGSRD